MLKPLLTAADRWFTNRLVQRAPKVFCIGFSKTGTTSLEKTFIDLGYTVGNQVKAENLLRDYINRNFEPIINYCKTAQVFQDHPFGLPETFKHLDKAFPNSKFILSIRDTPEQWYNSIINSHCRKFGNGSLPTVAHLKRAKYIWPGWIWEAMQAHYGVTEDDPYNKEKLVSTYVKHNQNVIDYFKHRDNLLVINLSDPASFKKFMAFIPKNYIRPGQHKTLHSFPWENKTSEHPIRDNH